ncbi:PIN domain-containing protein [Mucilaginibacter auburnensis]|uniref:PIN domain-containing protein n=1 Tax=Mucilaginibacter auburnensis TaxID=1457233 RepID=A0A2H9VRL0_9SPHI|nr:PIN domain-containing protein [Mucilaginibacter auburnensis]PJJ83445.1 PIN domain-containing protein [Mucilaginibacter auburnensis]
MTFKNLYLDSDVLLDMLLFREPFYGYTQLIFHYSENSRFNVSTSSLIFANMNYILSKKMGAVKAKESLRALSDLIEVLPFDKDAVNFALSSSFSDFEDAIQHHIAIKNNCDAIITRNIKDYKQATIPVLTAEQFLRTLS